MIVGLTGRSCSGKDRVASLLDDRFTVIDEDGLGHVALDANRDRIVEAFGEDILTEGKVDRKRLGPKVFSSPEALKTLESISHPWMVEETLRECREAEKEGKIPVINAAILEKMGFVEYCDEVILVPSYQHMNYGNSISPQFPLLVLQDIIYTKYMQGNHLIKVSLHSHTLKALRKEFE